MRVRVRKGEREDVKVDLKNRIKETRDVEKQELGLTNRDWGYLQFSQRI